MYIGLHLPQGIYAERLVGVDDGHGHDGGLRPHRALESARHEILQVISVIVITALGKDNITPSRLDLLRNLHDGLHLLLHVALVQPAPLYQVDKGIRDGQPGAVCVYDNGAGPGMDAHDPHGVVFPLMVGIHHIAALRRQKLLPPALRFNPAVALHDGNTPACHPVAPLLRKFLPMPVNIVRLGNIVCHKGQRYNYHIT